MYNLVPKAFSAILGLADKAETSPRISIPNFGQESMYITVPADKNIRDRLYENVVVLTAVVKSYCSNLTNQLRCRNSSYSCFNSFSSFKTYHPTQYYSNNII